MAIGAIQTADRLLLLCRPGFESDCGLEIQALAESIGVYGYIKTKTRQGFVEFILYDVSRLKDIVDLIKVDRLIFSRDAMMTGPLIENLNTLDRVSDLLAVLSPSFRCSKIVDWAVDSNEGKSLSKLTRKLLKPLELGFESAGFWQAESHDSLCMLFTATDHCYLGSLPRNACPKWPNSIAHLRFPAAAPSRSTLKLEEAILFFLDAKEQQRAFGLGKTAVDLGACPGGWTYQLVRRELQVTAIDNGPMDEQLMATGQVDHLKVDGFHYQPKYPVNWLVCDMIEKPLRIAELMADWVAQGWAQSAIFNLKLPMKKRYQEVVLCQQVIAERLGAKPYELKIKQLYHDREEVTAYLHAL